jgi:hypothetical protein
MLQPTEPSEQLWRLYSNQVEQTAILSLISMLVVHTADGIYKHNWKTTEVCFCLLPISTPPPSLPLSYSHVNSVKVQ